MPAGELANTDQRTQVEKCAASRRTIQCVDRALEILELLVLADEMRLKEISARTGLNPATCHHLLSTLVERGYVSRNRNGRTYVFGDKVRELTLSRKQKFAPCNVTVPALRQLNQDARIVSFRFDLILSNSI